MRILKLFANLILTNSAALIDRFNDSIIKQNSGLSQIHFDIIWKVDFVTSQIPEKR